MSPCQECQKKKVDFSIVEEAVRSTVFDKFILASAAHERITIGYVVL